MKLGAIYNVFDGEEFLQKSIENIRSSVDFIGVIFQSISNYGNPCSPFIGEFLSSMKSSGLIDYVFTVEPNFPALPEVNESRKRQAGLNLCRKQGCTHFICIDVDEFYDKNEFQTAKECIEKDGYDSSACSMYTYFKKPIYRLVPEENYFVPFIHKIKDNTFVGDFSNEYPVYVDRTRGVSGVNKFILFNKEELMMHHMSYVRKNIASKLNNSTAKRNFKNIDKYIEYFKSWKIGDKIYFPNNLEKEFSAVETEDIFSLSKIFEYEDGQ